MIMVAMMCVMEVEVKVMGQFAFRAFRNRKTGLRGLDIFTFSIHEFQHHECQLCFSKKNKKFSFHFFLPLLCFLAGTMTPLELEQILRCASLSNNAEEMAAKTSRLMEACEDPHDITPDSFDDLVALVIFPFGGKVRFDTLMSLCVITMSI